jgi:hypothetical protein
MPTPSCNHAHGLLSGMVSTASDRIAFVAAGAAASAPLWLEHVRAVSDVAAALGPTLAGLFLALKCALVIVEIWKAWRGAR